MVRIKDFPDRGERVEPQIEFFRSLSDCDGHRLDRRLHFGCHLRRQRFHLMALFRVHGSQLQDLCFCLGPDLECTAGARVNIQTSQLFI